MKRGIAIVALLLTMGLVYLFGWSPAFSVASVTIKTSDAKNLPLIRGHLQSTGLEISVGDRLARINARAIERSLKDQAWIGEVSFERNWISGEVRLTVTEKIPRFLVQEIGLLAMERAERFMTEDGAIFTLPGDLSKNYRNLPRIELRGSSAADRISAVALFDRIDQLFPTEMIMVTPLSTFITESQFQMASSDKPRSLRISWGGFEEIETKLIVISELTALKANRFVERIDVSNPQLPIVSNR